MVFAGLRNSRWLQLGGSSKWSPPRRPREMPRPRGHTNDPKPPFLTRKGKQQGVIKGATTEPSEHTNIYIYSISFVA